MKKTITLICLVILFFSANDISAQVITDTFYISISDNGEWIGGGTGYNEDGLYWFWYEEYFWLNQWFYDHPFDWERGKIIHIEFDVTPTSGPWGSSHFRVALNWSTPAWSALGYGDTVPPLPSLAIPEDTYIIREPIIGSWADPIVIDEPMHVTFDFVIYDYNPEWVSIDLLGRSVYIEGFIQHECVNPEVGTELQSWGAIKSMLR